jgi:hypothetical protein
VVVVGVGQGVAHLGRGDPAAAVGHVQEGAVVRAQCQAYIQGHRPVGVEQRPVSPAGEDVTVQPGAVERAACGAEEDAPAERAAADGQARVLTVFQIDAVLNAANTELRLGESNALSKVRRVVDGFSAPPHRRAALSRQHLGS